MDPQPAQFPCTADVCLCAATSYLLAHGYILAPSADSADRWSLQSIGDVATKASGYFRQLWRWWRSRLKIHLETLAALAIVDAVLLSSDDVRKAHIVEWASTPTLKLEDRELCNRFDILLMSALSTITMVGKR